MSTLDGSLLASQLYVKCRKIWQAGFHFELHIVVAVESQERSESVNVKRHDFLLSPLPFPLSSRFPLLLSNPSPGQRPCICLRLRCSYARIRPLIARYCQFARIISRRRYGERVRSSKFLPIPFLPSACLPKTWQNETLKVNWSRILRRRRQRANPAGNIFCN